jgi:hypothetical protein
LRLARTASSGFPTEKVAFLREVDWGVRLMAVGARRRQLPEFARRLLMRRQATRSHDLGRDRGWVAVVLAAAPLFVAAVPAAGAVAYRHSRGQKLHEDRPDH